MELKFGVDYIGVFVAAICFDGNGKFMMGKRSSKAGDRHGHWDFPGGKVELGEPLADALVREVEEECGVAPSDLHFLETIEFRESDRHYIGFYYAAHIESEKVYCAEPVYDEFAWFTLETLPPEIPDHEREAITRFVETYKLTT